MYNYFTLVRVMNKKRIAIIGAGVTGLTTSWLLHKQYAVTLFEKNDYLGGHTNTVIVQEDKQECPVDTGFIVFNNRNYPNLLGLFAELNVSSQTSDMSFAFSLSHGTQIGKLEYAGSNLNTLFAQRKNLFSIQHWQMLREILRFNQLAHDTLQASPSDEQLSLGAFLQQHGFSKNMQENYLLPMGAAIWSCPVETMLEFPARSFLQFFANHGLINLKDRPKWRTVTGGSFVYIQKMMARMQSLIELQPSAVNVRRHNNKVFVRTDTEELEFDAVIFACHADQALALLAEPTNEESSLLASFGYETNKTYLHTDTSLMPVNKKVWSSWNYLARTTADSRQQMTATYWMNQLQQLNTQTDYFVTLNPYTLPKQEKIIREIDYQHPIFTQDAINAQQAIPRIQGQNNTWFCGSYMGYGFHEDAVKSAVAVCKDFGIDPGWQEKYQEAA
jgi:predicted NAD/FAD-binding protein